MEAKPVSYMVGVDETNLRMPVRFLRMSDGTLGVSSPALSTDCWLSVRT